MRKYVIGYFNKDEFLIIATTDSWPAAVFIEKSYNEAYKIWEKAKVKKDERVVEIINALIKSTPEGLPVLLNRNPTIALGGILQMFCIGMTDTLTIGIPLQILKFLAAD